MTRLSLRPVRDSDLPILFEFQKDPTAVHKAAFTPQDPEDRRHFDAHWSRIRRDQTILIRTIEVDGEVVGSVLSYVLEDTPEVSYWIGAQYWGRGIATLALRVFLQIQAERPLLARVAADNLASIRVLQKCGFQIRSTTRGFANARGEEIEEHLMALD